VASPALNDNLEPERVSIDWISEARPAAGTAALSHFLQMARPFGFCLDPLRQINSRQIVGGGGGANGLALGCLLGNPA